MLLSAVVWFVLAAVLVTLALGLRYRRSETWLAVGSIALTILAVEGALCLAHPPSWRPLRKIPSRQYHHVDRPGAVMYSGRVEGTDVVVKTNEDGFRSELSREEFLRYRDRIVVLGDSFAFGANVRQEAAFPQQMEKIFRERLGREDVAVLNAGTISYSPLLGQRIFEGIERT